MSIDTSSSAVSSSSSSRLRSLWETWRSFWLGWILKQTQTLSLNTVAHPDLFVTPGFSKIDFLNYYYLDSFSDMDSGLILRYWVPSGFTVIPNKSSEISKSFVSERRLRLLKRWPSKAAPHTGFLSNLGHSQVRSVSGKDAACLWRFIRSFPLNAKGHVSAVVLFFFFPSVPFFCPSF